MAKTNSTACMRLLPYVAVRLTSWQNAHKMQVLCTERRQRVADFYMAFANAIIIVRRLIREGWKPYRWRAPGPSVQLQS
jgi:hypothetical protein